MTSSSSAFGPFGEGTSGAAVARLVPRPNIDDLKAELAALAAEQKCGPITGNAEAVLAAMDRIEDCIARRETDTLDLSKLGLTEDGMYYLSRNYPDFFSKVLSLDLSDNQLRSCKGLSFCCRLQNLDVSRNYLSSKAFPESLYSLESLKADDNNITNLDSISHFRSLKSLSLSGNDLFLNAQQGSLLPLSTLSRLEHLDLSRNYLPSLPSELPAGLKTLDVDANCFTQEYAGALKDRLLASGVDFDIGRSFPAPSPSLTNFAVARRMERALGARYGEKVLFCDDLMDLTARSSFFDVHHRDLQKLDGFVCTVADPDLSYALSNYTNLKRLGLAVRGPVDLSSMNKLKNLQSLSFWRDPLWPDSYPYVYRAGVLGKMPKLQSLSFSGVALRRFDTLQKLPKSLETLALNGVRASNLDWLYSKKNLRHLFVRDVRDFEPSRLTELTDLRSLILDSPLRSLEFLRGMTKMRLLNLGMCDVGDPARRGASVPDPFEPLRNLPRLVGLSLSPTVNIDLRLLSGAKELTYLSVEAPFLDDISPLADMTQLRELILSDGVFYDISPLANLQNLRLLWLSRISLDDPSPLANLSQLRRLNLPRCHLQDTAPLANLSELDILFLNENPLGDESLSHLSGLDNLRFLSLGSCNLHNADALSSLRSINRLQLARNHLENVDFLANLQNLRRLDISGNPIRQMDFITSQAMPNLDRLNVSGVRMDLSQRWALRSLMEEPDENWLESPDLSPSDRRLIPFLFNIMGDPREAKAAFDLLRGLVPAGVPADAAGGGLLFRRSLIDVISNLASQVWDKAPNSRKWIAQVCRSLLRSDMKTIELANGIATSFGDSCVDSMVVALMRIESMMLHSSVDETKLDTKGLYNAYRTDAILHEIAEGMPQTGRDPIEDYLWILRSLPPEMGIPRPPMLSDDSSVSDGARDYLRTVVSRFCNIDERGYFDSVKEDEVAWFVLRTLSDSDSGLYMGESVLTKDPVLRRIHDHFMNLAVNDDGSIDDGVWAAGQALMVLYLSDLYKGRDPLSREAFAPFVNLDPVEVAVPVASTSSVPVASTSVESARGGLNKVSSYISSGSSSSSDSSDGDLVLSVGSGGDLSDGISTNSLFASEVRDMRPVSPPASTSDESIASTSSASVASTSDESAEEGREEATFYISSGSSNSSDSSDYSDDERASSVGSAEDDLNDEMNDEISMGFSSASEFADEDLYRRVFPEEITSLGSMSPSPLDEPLRDSFNHVVPLRPSVVGGGLHESFVVDNALIPAADRDSFNDVVPLRPSVVGGGLHESFVPNVRRPVRAWSAPSAGRSGDGRSSGSSVLKSKNPSDFRSRAKSGVSSFHVRLDKRHGSSRSNSSVSSAGSRSGRGF